MLYMQGFGRVFPISVWVRYMGEIARLRVGDGVDHFDYDISPHYHFICSECGCVTDLELPFTQELTEAAREEFAGEIVGQITYFCGRCGDCIRG